MGTAIRPDLDEARRLAMAIAGSIARHCPSTGAEALGRKAAVMLGALATESIGGPDALAAAGQICDDLHSQSSVCPNNRLCSLHLLSQRLSNLLLGLPH